MRKKIETAILVSTLILGIWGVFMVFVTTANTPAFSGLYLRQLAAFAIGLLLLYALRFLPYQVLEEISVFLYAVALILLVVVLFAGRELYGSRRWFNLGFFHFQPVEFAKIAVVFFAAGIIKRRGSVVFSLLPVAAMFSVIILQPDIGSALPILGAYFAMLVVSQINIRWLYKLLPFVFIMGFSLLFESYLNANDKTLMDFKYLIYPGVFSLLAIFLFREIKQVKKMLKIRHLIGVLFLFWGAIGTGYAGASMLRDYQRRRVIAFLMPEIDPLGAGYSTRQSILAVGSGRLAGKGLMEGTQTQLGFLPIRHTDFIFASVAEELGFIGASVMLGLMMFLLWQFLKIIERCDDYGGRLIAAGIFGLFITHVILNLGVTLGMLPVIGIQMPLVSYGGTGMVMFLSMIGIMLSINAKTEIIGA